MDTTDKALLNVIQRSFPLEPRPYDALGTMFSITEAQVIDRINGLRGSRIIRQISPIFDTRALGYQSTLVAAKIPPAELSTAAQIINQHPGVSHNYERDNVFNLWFTIAVPPDSDLQGSVEALGRQAGATVIRSLPTLRLFKIGVTLDIEGSKSVTRKSEPEYSQSQRDAINTPLTHDDRELIRVIQDDLPAVPRPFDEPARQLAISTDELLARIAGMQERNYLRRFAAILFHRKAGFKANCMAVWKIPEERRHESGERMARFTSVSHCYLRPVYEDWPYSVFTMIHGRTKQDCDTVIEAIAAEVEPEELALIYSLREFKKTRVRYFTPEYGEWERSNMALTGSAVGQSA